MAGTLTTGTLNGTPSNPNLGAVALHPVADSTSIGVAAPKCFQTGKQDPYNASSTVPSEWNSLASTMSDPSRWGA